MGARMANVIDFYTRGMPGDLRAWRLRIANDRAGAEGIARHVIRQMKERDLFHPTELARYYAHMMNGVSHPGEFGVNTETGLVKRG